MKCIIEHAEQQSMAALQNLMHAEQEERAAEQKKRRKQVRNTEKQRAAKAAARHEVCIVPTKSISDSAWMFFKRL